MAEPADTFRISAVEKGFRFEFDVAATRGERQKKVATFGGFEILCDEGAQMGGDNSAPPPLAYFGASIAF